VNFKTKTARTAANAHITTFASPVRSARSSAWPRARARSIWTAAQRLWLRPRLRRSARPGHTRHPAVSSNLLRLLLFLRHTLMSAINYTSTFWGVVVFADSLFPLPFQHGKLWIKTIWNVKRAFSVFMMTAYVNACRISYSAFKRAVMIWNVAGSSSVIVFFINF